MLFGTNACISFISFSLTVSVHVGSSSEDNAQKIAIAVISTFLTGVFVVIGAVITAYASYKYKSNQEAGNNARANQPQNRPQHRIRTF